MGKTKNGFWSRKWFDSLVEVFSPFSAMSEIPVTLHRLSQTVLGLCLQCQAPISTAIVKATRPDWYSNPSVWYLNTLRGDHFIHWTMQETQNEVQEHNLFDKTILNEFSSSALVSTHHIYMTKKQVMKKKLVQILCQQIKDGKVCFKNSYSIVL